MRKRASYEFSRHWHIGFDLDCWVVGFTTSFGIWEVYLGPFYVSWI